MSTPLRVLILEDHQADAELMLYELRQAGFAPDWKRVDTAEAYLAVLDHPDFDIILADYHMPQFEAPRALQLLLDRGLDIPVIIVTGSVSEEAAVQCMKQGAADYLLKDRLTRLGQAVNHALEQKRLRAEKQRTDADLRASLKEKETLLREIHHRVKNNLQIISSLLSLQSNYVTDPKALTIIRECQTRVRSMALIHETLYRSQDLARIDFANYVSNLTSYLGLIYATNPDHVRLKSEVEHLYLNIDTAIYCGLLLSELITNCLKHAFPAGRRGTIELIMRRAADGRFVLSVADDGVGLPADVDFARASTMGVLLIQTLTEQLHATMRLERDTGLKVEISFAE